MSVRDSVISAGCLYDGDIVEFNYDGGSDPGSKRVVYVLGGSTNKNIMTWDFDKETLRTFSRSKIRNVRFLEDNEYKIVQLDNLPKTLIAENCIAEDFEDEGYKVYANGDEVVAVKPTKKNNLLRGYSNGKIFFDVNGASVGLEVGLIDGNVKLLVDNNEYYPATVEDLANIFNS